MFVVVPDSVVRDLRPCPMSDQVARWKEAQAHRLGGFPHHGCGQCEHIMPLG